MQRLATPSAAMEGSGVNFVLLLLIAAAASSVPTVRINGQTCEFVPNRIVQPPFALVQCGQPYSCPYAGVVYAPDYVLTIPGVCQNDRLFSARFEP